METRNVKAKRFALLAIGAALLALLSVGVSFIVTRVMIERDPSWEHDQARGHDWLHEQLALTNDEAAAVDAFEPEYRRERDRLLTNFNDRIANLRKLLADRDRFSPEVIEAIHGLHSVHGELQELSIRHYFDMLSVLPSEKKEKLKKLAAEALSEPE